MSNYGKQLSKIIDLQQNLKEEKTRVSGLVDEVSALRAMMRFIAKVVNKDRSVRFRYCNGASVYVVVPVSLICDKEELVLRGYDLHRMLYGDYQLQFITPVFLEDE